MSDERRKAETGPCIITSYEDMRFQAAVAAMQGLMQSMHVGFKMDPRSYTGLADEAIAHADALLAALEESK